jgi:RHS repeat-associated protein
MVSTALFNGNISETFWKSPFTDNVKRKYSYQYDDLNRLLKANYSRGGGSSQNSYLEHLTYDKNGNIQTLLRHGGNDAGDFPFIIDNLTYTYDQDNKNLLKKVFDASNSPQGFKDDATGLDDTTDDYRYDANGNMTIDTNKGISRIYYNHLNLPTRISFGNGNFISYLYTANGQKVQKIVQNNSPLTVDKVDYLGGFQYHNQRLKHFPHPEGYVDVDEENLMYFKYVFHFTDHLGNIRLSYSDTNNNNSISPGEILEENHYYPFGLKHSGYNTEIWQPSYKFKYNGKEWQDELGLNVTAMDYRQYDNALGRFNSMDRLAELAPMWSTYRFAFNNPVYWKDPTGLFEDNIDNFENNNLEKCPTCPNSPEFQPLIDDETYTYIYNPETKKASLLISEVEVVGKKKSTSSVTSDPLFWINSALGFTSLYVGYKANFHLQNEWWHQSKNNGKIHNIFEQSWNKSKYKNVRTHQTSKFQLPRNIGNGLAVASLVMTGVNVYKNGELKASDVLNASMAAISFTGVGSVVAGIYFVADFSTMGISYLTTGEAKGIGTYLDEFSNGGLLINKNDFEK